jgi:hypothetical protein
MALAGELDHPVAEKSRLAADEPERRAGVRDPPAHPVVPQLHDRVLPRDDRGEVDLHLARVDAEAPPRARDMGRASAGDERLRGRAAGVRAGTAELPPLREEHRLAGAR